MVGLISSVLAFIGSFVSTLGTSACVMLFAEEPVCPKSLIK